MSGSRRPKEAPPPAWGGLPRERTGGRGQLDGQRHGVGVPRDRFDHAARDEITAEFGLLHGAQGVMDGGLADGGHGRSSPFIMSSGRAGRGGGGAGRGPSPSPA